MIWPAGRARTRRTSSSSACRSRKSRDSSRVRPCSPSWRAWPRIGPITVPTRSSSRCSWYWRMMKTNPMPTIRSVRVMIAANARIRRARSELPGRSAPSHDAEAGRSAVTAGKRAVGCSSKGGASGAPASPGAVDAPGSADGGDGCSGLGLVTATGGPRGKLIGGDDLVADAPDGLDAGLAGGELLAQPGDVDVDGARVAAVIVAPGNLEQALAVEDDAGAGRQRRQQVELLGA